MFNNETLNKKYRNITILIVLNALILLSAIGTAAYAIINTTSKQRNVSHLNYYMYDTQDNTDEIAYLDLIGFYQFASYGDDLGFYIAYDDDFYYVVSIKEKDFEYFAAKFDDADTIRVYGYTSDPQYEMKRYAIESVNDDYETDYITSDYDDIFGDLYLELERDNSVMGHGAVFHLQAPALMAALVMGIIGGLFLYLGLQDHKSFEILKSNGLMENNILNEINSVTAKYYPGINLYLTDNYLVSLNGKVNVVEYDNIFWVYVTNHRTNFVSDYSYLNVVRDNGKNIVCGNSSIFTKKSKEGTQETQGEIINTIYEKNNNVLIGYTQDNIEASRNLHNNK